MTLPILVILAIAIGLWLCWKYEPPKPLTWQVALRYLLQCCIILMCGLLAMRDPLLIDWSLVILGGAALALCGLVLVLVGELCPS